MAPYTQDDMIFDCFDQQTTDECQQSSSSLCSYEFMNHTEEGPLHDRDARQRSVRFCDDNKVIETLHIKDMEEQEIDASWHSYEELRAMKMDCVSLVGMLEDEELAAMLDDDDDEFCLRGLKEQSGSNRERKCNTRKQLYKEVFDIQQASNESDHNETHELIAEASRRTTSQEMEAALELGRADALVAGIQN
eukprot:Nitzschia sp. Nitz4//scaffold83_size84149//58255//58830//NITZ4_005180-RA/size84149-processed-gene-0.37-mRNA-1//1//CDS//3329558965//3365//frame0